MIRYHFGYGGASSTQIGEAAAPAAAVAHCPRRGRHARVRPRRRGRDRDPAQLFARPRRHRGRRRTAPRPHDDLGTLRHRPGHQRGRRALRALLFDVAARGSRGTRRAGARDAARAARGEPAHVRGPGSRHTIRIVTQRDDGSVSRDDLGQDRRALRSLVLARRAGRGLHGGPRGRLRQARPRLRARVPDPRRRAGHLGRDRRHRQAQRRRHRAAEMEFPRRLGAGHAAIARPRDRCKRIRRGRAPRRGRQSIP